MWRAVVGGGDGGGSGRESMGPEMSREPRLDPRTTLAPENIPDGGWLISQSALGGGGAGGALDGPPCADTMWLHFHQRICTWLPLVRMVGGSVVSGGGIEGSRLEWLGIHESQVFQRANLPPVLLLKVNLLTNPVCLNLSSRLQRNVWWSHGPCCCSLNAPFRPCPARFEILRPCPAGHDSADTMGDGNPLPPSVDGCSRLLRRNAATKKLAHAGDEPCLDGPERSSPSIHPSTHQTGGNISRIDGGHSHVDIWPEKRGLGREVCFCLRTDDLQRLVLLCL